MLSSGAEEPLVTSVEPWNGIRVTLKVSRENAALLQTLAQRQDAKLRDTGILSIQVEGSNPVRLNQAPVAASCKQNSADDRIKFKSATKPVVSSSAHVPVCEPSLSGGLLLPTPPSVAQNLLCSRTTSLASNVNQSWHPLVDQRTVTTNDDSSSWDPFGYNGLSVDPFQFSADDLLTRMLADVPAPKRRQRIRKGSSPPSNHGIFSSSNTASLTVPSAEDINSKFKLSNAPYSVSCRAAFGLPSGILSLTSPKDRAGVGNVQCLSSPCSTQVNDLYSVRVGNNSMPAISPHSLYHPHHPLKDSTFSTAGMLPFSLDSLMTVSNYAAAEERSKNSDQPPVKRRRVKSRHSARSEVSDSFISRPEMHHESPYRDICTDTGTDALVTDRSSVRQNEMHVPTTLTSRYMMHSPRALWSDTAQGRTVLHPGYPGVDAYRFRLPCEQSSMWTHSNSSYMYSGAPGSSPSFVTDVRKPLCIAGGMTAQSSVSASLSNHCLSEADVAVSGTTWPPYPQPSFGSVEMPHSGIYDRLTRPGGYMTASVTTCPSFVDRPHMPAVGDRPTAASGSHVGIVSEACSTVELPGIVASSVQPVGIVQSTSPREGWTGSDSDYGGASVTDSGIASNTSLSVGSDHSENDRGSVEMNAADQTGSAKLSPVSTADRACPPSSPLPAGAPDCLSEQPPDGSVSTGNRVMWMNPTSAGQNGDSCIASNKSSAETQNWLNEKSSQSDSKKSGQTLPSARMRFARRSRQTPTLAGECPPAITCPSLPRRLSESVKRAMRGGAAPDPPITSAPCDIGPTKVVIRITKTRCSGTGEAKKSKQKEQWCVQPIVKPFQSPTHLSSDVVNPVNGSLHCVAANSTSETCTDSVTNSIDKSPHQKESGSAALLHSEPGRRDSCQSSGVSSRLVDSVVQQLDLFPPTALSATRDEPADVDEMVSTGQESVTHGPLQLVENGARISAVVHELT